MHVSLKKVTSFAFHKQHLQRNLIQSVLRLKQLSEAGQKPRNLHTFPCQLYFSLQPVNFESKLAVLKFSQIFGLICF